MNYWIGQKKKIKMVLTKLKLINLVFNGLEESTITFKETTSFIMFKPLSHKCFIHRRKEGSLYIEHNSDLDMRIIGVGSTYIVNLVVGEKLYIP